MDGGGGGNSNSLRFCTFSWKKRTKNHPIYGDIALIVTIHYPNIKRSYRVGVSHFSTDTTFTPIIINHLYSLSIGAARGAENDPISTVRLRSLT